MRLVSNNPSAGRSNTDDELQSITGISTSVKMIGHCWHGDITLILIKLHSVSCHCCVLFLSKRSNWVVRVFKREYEKWQINWMPCSVYVYNSKGTFLFPSKAVMITCCYSNPRIELIQTYLFQYHPQLLELSQWSIRDHPVTIGDNDVIGVFALVSSWEGSQSHVQILPR